MVENVVKVCNKGMISIPAALRKKYKIKDGDSILVKEDDDGNIRLIPIESVEALRQRALTVEEFREIYEKSRKEDRELER
jgi:AbrB family looped-hinge helix DNA binding protein